MDGNKSWRAGWWDFYPLLERPKRPLQWSQSSVIFTVHPLRPIITARHFSSSKQFVLPSPNPIVTSPASYEPATVMSVSPGDEWLLAYFPRRDGEGLACIWKRGPHIDNWMVKECWNFPKGSGILTASWLGRRREWIAGTTGLPERLPPRGPPVPISDMTLLLVTQDHYVHLTFVRHYGSGLKTLKRSLMLPGVTWENSLPVDATEVNGTRHCVEAAIALGYNEKGIIIATHSRKLPPPAPATVNTSAFNTMDLSVSGDLTSPDHKVVEWDNWGEEQAVDLHEVQIRFDGSQLGLGLSPIASLECLPHFISGLTFVCTPPPMHPTPSAEPSASPSLPKLNTLERGRIGLVISYIDFHDYASPPTSTLTLFLIAQRMVGNRGVWGTRQASTRTLETGIVSHLEPFIDYTGTSTVLMYASILDTSTISLVGKAKSHPAEITVGHLKVLTVPSLTEHSQWGSTPIKIPATGSGRALPLFTCLSQNRRLFCTLTSSLWQNQIAIYPSPLPENSDTSSTRLPLTLATAILGRLSSADLIHTLCSPQTTIADVAEVLYQALDILHKYSDDTPNDYSWEMLGLATEVYRAKSSLTKSEEQAETLKDRWEAAQDMCFLAACNLAFECCKDNETYDLEAAWQMIEICQWVIAFTERLVKTCVLSHNAEVAEKEDPQHDSDVLSSPILLALSHPFSFNNLLIALRHVKEFRTFVGSLPAGGENAQVAQSVLIDAVDRSGIELGSLISLLEDHYTESVKKVDPDECRKALAACQPTGMMLPHLSRLLRRISEAQGILNKSTLFIKPNDLVDGVARLSLGSQSQGDDRDVVSREILNKQEHKDVCLRCGGKTTISREVVAPRGHYHSKWHLFELMWQLRCVCGGAWSFPVR